MKGVVIRACDLQVNDIFLKQNVEYVVSDIRNSKIYYRVWDGSRVSQSYQNFIGGKSLEHVVLTGKRVFSKINKTDEV